MEEIDDKRIVMSEKGDMKILIDQAEGEKCQRCWNFSTSVGENKDEHEICERCAGIIS